MLYKTTSVFTFVGYGGCALLLPLVSVFLRCFFDVCILADSVLYIFHYPWHIFFAAVETTLSHAQNHRNMSLYPFCIHSNLITTVFWLYQNATFIRIFFSRCSFVRLTLLPPSASAIVLRNLLFVRCARSQLFYCCYLIRILCVAAFSIIYGRCLFQFRTRAQPTGNIVPQRDSGSEWNAE